MNFGNTSFGASPSTPAHGQPGLLQPQGANAFTPQSRPQLSPQNTVQLGQQSALATPQGQHNPSSLQTNSPYSPAPQPSMNAQPSPMQPGQAPVNYLPGYLSKMRGADRVRAM